MRKSKRAIFEVLQDPRRPVEISVHVDLQHQTKYERPVFARRQSAFVAAGEDHESVAFIYSFLHERSQFRVAIDVEGDEMHKLTPGAEGYVFVGLVEKIVGVVSDY
jgi:hypothetical protein